MDTQTLCCSFKSFYWIGDLLVFLFVLSHFKLTQYIPIYLYIGIPRTNSMGKVSDLSSSISTELPNSEESIRRGEYAVIRSLIRVLEVPDISSSYFHYLQ